MVWTVIRGPYTGGMLDVIHACHGYMIVPSLADDVRGVPRVAWWRVYYLAADGQWIYHHRAVRLEHAKRVARQHKRAADDRAGRRATLAA